MNLAYKHTTFRTENQQENLLQLGVGDEVGDRKAGLFSFFLGNIFKCVPLMTERLTLKNSSSNNKTHFQDCAHDTPIADALY